MADPEEFPFEVGVTYNLEASAVGSKLTLRAWKVGDERPATPILYVFDRRLPPSAGSGIAAIAFFDPVPLMDAGVTEVEISATVDDITFTAGLVR